MPTLNFHKVLRAKRNRNKRFRMRQKLAKILNLLDCDERVSSKQFDSSFASVEKSEAKKGNPTERLKKSCFWKAKASRPICKPRSLQLRGVEQFKERD